MSAGERSVGTAARGATDVPLAFSYHRAVSPMLWVLVALCSVELVVVHLLVALWSGRVALVLTIVSLAGIGWLIVGIARFRRLPVLLTNHALLMRVGQLKSVSLPLGDSAGLRRAWDGAAVKHRSVLNLALIAYPNVVIDLKESRPGRRGVRAIAHRLDDPERFTEALTAALDRARVSD